MIKYSNSKILTLNKEFYIFFIIILCFTILRIFKYLESDYLVIWFDSAQYASVSLASIWTIDFWSAGIPPLYPFFLKHFQEIGAANLLVKTNLLSIFSYEPHIIRGLEELPDFPYYLVKDNFNIVPASIFQLFFSIFSWVVLALTFSKSFNNFHIKLIAIIFLLFLGQESSVLLWDKHIVTESIAISILALLISSLIMIKLVMKNNIYLLIFLLLLAATSFIKITNNYFLLLLVPYITLYYYKFDRNNTARFTIIIFALLSLFVFNQYMLFKGDRTHVPMKDIISSRISTEGYEDIYKYFRDAGMPEIPEELLYKLWTAPFEDYPELNDWWLNKSSKTYQKYLITHPDYFFLRPLQEKNNFNKPVYSFFTPDLHYHEQVVSNKTNIIFTDLFLWVSFLTLFIFILFMFKGNKKYNLTVILLPLFLLFSSYILYLIIWHADIGELDRHLIQCALMMRLGLIMMLFGIVNIMINNKYH